MSTLPRTPAAPPSGSGATEPALPNTEDKPPPWRQDAGASAEEKPPLWRQDDGAPVSCLEKIKVLNENYAELRQISQDAFEDALLIGCSEAQVREVLHALVDALRNPYPGTRGGKQDDC